MHFGDGESRLAGNGVEQVRLLSLLEKSGVAQRLFAPVQCPDMSGSERKIRAFPRGLRAQTFLRQGGLPLLPV